MQTVVLKGAHIVTPREVTKADLLIKGTRIARLGTNLSGDKPIDCEGCYVLPGFRDQHIHDINGFNKHLDDPQRLAKVSKALASQGVAAYIIATTAAPLGKLTSYMNTICRSLGKADYIDYLASGMCVITAMGEEAARGR